MTSRTRRTGYNPRMADDQQASRRDFLRGRSALRALLDRTQRAADEAAGAFRQARPEPTAAQPGLLLSARRRAMATEFQIDYRASGGAEATDAVLAALGLIERVEDQLTVYRDWSEVVDINHNAAARPVEVDPQLLTLLRLCDWLARATGGAFDITSGPLSRVWGFFRREGRVPGDEELAAARNVVGYEKLELSEQLSTIRFAQRGMEINFNSIGKGYALDRAAESLLERGVDGFLMHGGHSSVLAWGSPRGDAADGWSIGVPHPLRRSENLGEVRLRNRALGTAGDGTQFFEHEGRRYGHVIDPRTGQPAEGVFTATAVADTAAEADALATAFYVLGPGGTAEYCAAHDDVSAVLVCPGEGDEEFDVHTFNLAPSDWVRTDG